MKIFKLYFYFLQRILLLVNHDVDAICACKILHCLLRSDNVVYTSVAVQGMKDLEDAYKDNCDKVSTVTLFYSKILYGLKMGIPFIFKPDLF